MVEALIGFISGIIGGLGMGGGTVLILFLSILLGIQQHIAQATNIIFFVPTAISAIVISLKNKNIDLKTAIPVSIWGIAGALIGSIISMSLNVSVLKKCFGAFLIMIATYQIYEYIKNKKRHNNIKQQKGGKA